MSLDDFRYQMTRAIETELKALHGPEAIIHRNMDGDLVDESDWGILSYPEPADSLQAIPLARKLRDMASSLFHDYAAAARGLGKPWREVASALGIEDSDDPAIDAFRLIAGEPSQPFDEVYVYWRCRSCKGYVRDVGPWGGHPDDNERGHADGCVRLAAEIAEYTRGWDDDDDEIAPIPAELFLHDGSRKVDPVQSSFPEED